MYSTCLFCHAALGKNEAIEHFPVGRWLAFDSAKGRLWVVCRACERWSLSPVEERWEAIEECERAFGETKLRASTEQIGLARLREGTTLVRIGAPQRPEMAAWRYGDQFGRRRRRALVLAAGTGLATSVVRQLGPTVGGLASGFTSIVAVQLIHYALTFRSRRKVESVEVGSTTVRVSRVALGHVRLRRNEEFGYELEIPNLMSWRDNMHLSAARRKLSWEQRTRYVVHGDQAVAVARRALPRVNAAGGNAKVVTNAVSVLEAAGGVGDVFNKLASSEHERSRWGQPLLLRLWPSGVRDVSDTLSGLPAPVRLAMEMALHEEDERRALEGELTVLEERWKEAEEIAAISDDMFLPASILDRVRRRD